jgi:tetratricopeptide (TPR) repeat protein
MTRDVFICFSKARPGEAKVALALKDALEQLGLFAFEYEDWSWVAEGLSDSDGTVDRSTLAAMLSTCSVVVLISPHEGSASIGVQTEIAELRRGEVPVILLHWSPGGWHPLLDPPELEGLNIIWSLQGTSMRVNDVADNQCTSLARQLATGCWLAYQVKRLRNTHPRTVDALFARMPAVPGPPLLSFELQTPANEPQDRDEPIDVMVTGSHIVRDATEADLQAFATDWRDGTDLMAQVLAQEAQFSLIRPMQTFQRACEALCAHAEHRVGARREISARVLSKRGLMLVRLDRNAEAVAVLERALAIAPADERFEIHRSLALAYEPHDLAAAIHSLTCAIACVPDPELECALRYNRGVLRQKAVADDVASIEDFAYVVERAGAALRHSALRARARVLTRRDDYEGAIADHTRVLEHAHETPRTAVSSWMDRGMLYRLQGRTSDAIADWTRGIEAADAHSDQRLKLLQARAELLEQTGRPLEAAADLEAMALHAKAPREELRAHAARLRSL